MKYQLAIQFPSSGIADFDLLVALEDALIASLDSGSIVDGHDFGSGEMNIFIHTDSPSAAFTQCLQIISNSGLTLAGAGFRRVRDTQYKRVWPPGALEPFRVV